jgi:GNAT superfamily N-acetyltransferase
MVRGVIDMDSRYSLRPGGRISGAVLRLVQPTDSIRELTDLLHRAYTPLAQSGFRFLAAWQDESATRRRIASGECWVAEIDGRIVGTATLRPPGGEGGTPWYLRADVAVVGQFAVDPACQRLGLGTALLEHIEGRARALGAAHLAMDTAEGATHLIHYYTRLGYRFVEHAQWEVTNYRSVVLSKQLGGAPASPPESPASPAGG